MIQKWSLNDEDSVDSNDNTRNWKKYQSIKIELSDTGCILEGKLRLTGDGPDHFQFYTERRFKGLNPFNNPLFDTNFHSIKISCSIYSGKSTISGIKVISHQTNFNS